MLENSYPIRTDLALESQERLQEDQADMRGIRVLEERRENGVIVSTVMIETENASVAMGRPKGTYITIEAPEMIEEDAGYHRDISLELAKIMRNLLPGKEIEKNLKKGLEVAALVVGLGNREVTPDALGPRVVDNLFITRHILNEFGTYAFQREDVGKVSGIVPGVMAQTGMECVEILKGVVKETKPDFLITVDALAARSSKRLNRTIQISDAGIHPGAGVGNHRSVITKETMGIPVIAIGVPTVVDAATIVNDTMENFIAALETSENLKGVGVVLQGYNSAEKYELVKELIAPHLNGMFVTPKDIDETIRRISYTVSEALNLLFSGKAGESEKKEETA